MGVIDMMTAYHRAADDVDLKALTHERGSLWRNLATASLPVAALTFGIVYAVWRSALTAGIIATGLFLASVLSNIRFFRHVKHRENQKKDANAVEVFEISASHVFDIEPLGDNAPALCFFLDEGKALLLVGQWLLEVDSFPADSFRLHRWADTKKPIRIEVTGQPLKAGHSTVRLRPRHRFGKMEMLDATPETLQDDLDRVLGRDVGAPS